MTEPFRWHRTVAVAFAILFVIVAVWACAILFTERKAGDFLSYWAAAKLAVGGQAALAYDVQAHRAVELAAAPVEGLLPFAYPPPFLLLIVPLGLLSYPAAFAVWLALSACLFAVASARVAPLHYRLAHPQAIGNALIGQNAFLTSAIFIAGTARLERAPFLGGAILGLLALKPQLALLLPVALIADRQWRAIAGGALSTAALLLAAFALLGPAAYGGFLDIVPLFTGALAAESWPWNELASTFAFARHLGIPHAPALALHAIVALAAAVLAWRAWRARREDRVAVLAAATLLVPPYLFTYDALLMVVPMGWFVVRQRHPRLVALMWLFCLLPIATYFGGYPGPNTIPLAAMLALWALERDSRRIGQFALEPPAGAAAA